MKKTLLTTALLAGLSASVYGQGIIFADNSQNFLAGVTDPTLTSGGVVFFNTTPSPIGAQLQETDFNYTLLGGSTVGSLAPLTTVSSFLGNNTGMLLLDGVFSDTSQPGGPYAITGVPVNGTATLEIEMWTGTDATFAAAQVDPTAMVAQATWTQLTGGGGTPPAVAPNLIGMPSMILAPAPEPSTLALASLGAAALMFLRRRSS